MIIDKRVLNFLVIIILSLVTFWWTFFIFHLEFVYDIVISVIVLRIVFSFLLFKDYTLSWSKATQKTFLIKSIVYGTPFLLYAPYFYGEYRFAFMLSELMLYIFCVNFLMYSYYYYCNYSGIKKTKNIVIYGAGKAGLQLKEEFDNSKYKIIYFCDDNKNLQKRSIDNINIVSLEKLQTILKDKKSDLLVIAMPSASKSRTSEIYNELHPYFEEIKILPSLENILRNKNFTMQLKNISVEDLLARNPKDLDIETISNFIKDKKILITGAGGSIGSEIVRQCYKFKAKELILLDNSEFNLYQILEEMKSKNDINIKITPLMQTVQSIECLEKTFNKFRPQIVIHAAAYKHVPLVEYNVSEAILNNIIGTKNCIDMAIKYKVQKFVLISTDKAVRPTNVMGATKRVCELYAQNIDSKDTDIVAVRFGNVLGSSGSVIPKFKSQIEEGKNITVTHPDITRYFMLIPEACMLVLQAASIAKGGEIFILDMGNPIKIVDLAKKMISLSGRKDINIEFCGLRPGEKLYEELLINDSDKKTEYESIMVAGKSEYNIKKLNNDINELIKTQNKLTKLKEIIPEFNHKF